MTDEELFELGGDIDTRTIDTQLLIDQPTSETTFDENSFRESPTNTEKASDREQTPGILNKKQNRKKGSKADKKEDMSPFQAGFLEVSKSLLKPPEPKVVSKEEQELDTFVSHVKSLMGDIPSRKAKLKLQRQILNLIFEALEDIDEE